MTRVIRLGHRYHRSADRLGVIAGSERGRAVGLAQADRLPATGDVRALIPPTHEAFVRRVPGRNLWLWFTLRDGEVNIVGLTADPPIPAPQ